MYNYLSLALNLVFVACGLVFFLKKKVSSSQYWLFMVVPIIGFGLLYGLRTGWLGDFALYEYTYDHFDAKSITERFSFIFSNLMILGKTMGVSFNVLTTFLNIIVIFGFLYYAKPFARGFAFILPLFFVYSFMTAQFIAFFPAISVFLISVSLFQQKRYKAAFVALVVSIGFHKGIVLAVPIYFLAHYVNFKLSFAIIAYLISFFFNNQLWIDFLNEMSTLISFETGDYYGRYITDIENFYTGDHAIEDKGLSLFYTIRMVIINCSALMLFYKYAECMPQIKQYRIFELSVIGLILTNMTMGVQLVNRYAIIFTLFTPILYACAFLFCIKKKNKKYLSLSVLFMGLLFYTHISMFLLRNVSNMHFIWEY